MKDLQLFLCITKKSDSNDFTSFFLDNGISYLLSNPCTGSTRKELLDTFGLVQTEKVLFLTILPSEQASSVLKKMNKEMMMYLPDKGIACTIPVDTISSSTIKTFTDGNLTDKEENDMNTSDYEMIMCITESGYSNVVMDAARAGGAGGGTIIHAKGTKPEEKGKFFGMTIADDKELVIIVADKDSKVGIMKSILDKAGANSEAATKLFSVPVTETAGFSFSVSRLEQTSII